MEYKFMARHTHQSLAGKLPHDRTSFAPYILRPATEHEKVTAPNAASRFREKECSQPNQEHFSPKQHKISAVITMPPLMSPITSAHFETYDKTF